MRPIENHHFIRQVIWDLTCGHHPASETVSYLIPKSEWNEIYRTMTATYYSQQLTCFAMPDDEGLTFFQPTGDALSLVRFYIRDVRDVVPGLGGVSRWNLNLCRDAFQGGIKAVQPANRLYDGALAGAAQKLYREMTLTTNGTLNVTGRQAPEYMQEVEYSRQRALYFRIPEEINPMRGWDHYQTLMLMWADKAEEDGKYWNAPEILEQIREDHEEKVVLGLEGIL